MKPSSAALVRSIIAAAGVASLVAACSLQASTPIDAGPSSQTSSQDSDLHETSPSTSRSPSSTSSTSASDISIPDGYQEVETPTMHLTLAVPEGWVNVLDDPDRIESLALRTGVSEEKVLETFDVFYQTLQAQYLPARNQNFSENINVNLNSFGKEPPSEDFVNENIGQTRSYETATTAAGEIVVADLEEQDGIYCTTLFVPDADGNFHPIYVNALSPERTRDLADVIISTLH